jgi:tRNA modification GTPase
VVFGGVPVTLVDTAGLRETSDSIEAEGVRRARARADEADLVIEVVEVDASAAACSSPASACTAVATPPTDAAGGTVSAPARPVATPPTEAPGETALALVGPGAASARTLVVANKCDLGGDVPPGALPVSALTGEGLDILHTRLADAARDLTETSGPPPLTQMRHRVALEAALEHLGRAEHADLPELRGEDLRLALRALGRITGQVGVEDILDTLFARFCIGK